MATELERKLAITLLKERLERLTGKKIILKENSDLDKIYYRQKEAIKKFGFLTLDELNSFIDLVEKNPSLLDKYFDYSTGYKNEKEHREVSQVLAKFIKNVLEGDPDAPILIEEGFSVQSPSPKPGQDPMF